MRLYEFDPYTGYERLQRASPEFMDEVVEAQAIWSAEGEEADSVREGITQQIENTLIRYANNAGCVEYEDFFYIDYAGALPDIDFRRAMIAATFIGQHHIGRPEILAILGLFTRDGQDRAVQFRFGLIEITVDGYLSDEAAFINMLFDKLPTHLGLAVTLSIHHRAEWHVPLKMGASAWVQYESTAALTEHTGRRHLVPAAAMFQNTHFTGCMAPRGHTYTPGVPMTTAVMCRVTHTAKLIKEDD